MATRKVLTPYETKITDEIGQLITETNRFPVDAVISSGGGGGALDLSRYYVNHEELIFGVTVAGVKFIGRAQSTGEWIILCIREENNIRITEYASVVNNPSYLTYIDAWTNRASLDCDRIENMVPGDIFVLGTDMDDYIVTNNDEFIEVD